METSNLRWLVDKESGAWVLQVFVNGAWGKVPVVFSQELIDEAEEAGKRG